MSKLVSIDGEKLIELRGFKFDDEILISDSDSMNGHEKVVLKVPPSFIKFWLEQNENYIEKNLGISIMS